MSHVRMDPDERKRLILEAALKVTRKLGFRKATRAKIAEEAGVTPGLISVYFGGRDTLRLEIFKTAVKREDTKIIRNGLDEGIGAGVRIPSHLRAA